MPLQVESPQSLQPAPGLRKAKLAVYSSYSFATWGWRTWEFAVVLILLHFNPNSLRLVSIYGILESAIAVLCGSAIGSYIDKHDRLTGASTMYIIQNSCVAASATASGLYVLFETHVSKQVKAVLVAVTVAAGAASSAGSQGVRVAVEKDWVKCLCSGDAASLTRMNSSMRAVDLSCLLLAPVMSGLLMTYAGLKWAVAAILAFNLTAALPEMLLLRAAYHTAPDLRAPRQAAATAPPATANTPAPAEKPPSWGGRIKAAASGWLLYTQQPVLLPAVALALLYCTVLSLGYQMTSYLTWHHISEAQVAAVRSAGALSGLAASASFPWLLQRLGLQRCGLLGIWWQLSCLVVAILPVAFQEAGGRRVAHPAAEMGMLLGGLVMSRFGLWLFDLAVTQTLQQGVPDDQLGTVCGVQDSLQNALGLAGYVAGLVLHQPHQFPALMLASCGFVATAAALYTIYVVLAGGQEPGRGGPGYSALVDEDGVEEGRGGRVGSEGSGTDGVSDDGVEHAVRVANKS